MITTLIQEDPAYLIHQNHNFDIVSFLKKTPEHYAFFEQIQTLTNLNLKSTQQAIDAGYVCISPFKKAGSFYRVAASWLHRDVYQQLLPVLNAHQADLIRLAEEKEQRSIARAQAKAVKETKKLVGSGLHALAGLNLSSLDKTKAQATGKGEIPSMTANLTQVAETTPARKLSVDSTTKQLKDKKEDKNNQKKQNTAFLESIIALGYLSPQQVADLKGRSLSKDIAKNVFFKVMRDQGYELTGSYGNFFLMTSVCDAQFTSQRALALFTSSLEQKMMHSQFAQQITQIYEEAVDVFLIEVKSEIDKTIDEEVKANLCSWYDTIVPQCKQQEPVLSLNHQRNQHDKKLISLTLVKEMSLQLLEQKQARQYQEKLVASFHSLHYKDMFTHTRQTAREFVFYAGPTNSGKTYQAFLHVYANHEKERITGIYLAPLRLLALEAFETLTSKGVACNLITGEERQLVENAHFQSSTVEVAPLNAQIPLDLAIIDEVGMLYDKQRGASWLQAVVGVNAKKIILAGPAYMEPVIKELVEEYLQESLLVVHCERKSGLIIKDKPVRKLQQGDAVIVFTRRDIFEYKQKLEQQGLRVSVIYGALSPEVRSEQARLFREGKTDVLVSTDAIAMGLNLPIKRVIFSTIAKYDGYNLSRLTPELVIQIAGRAGRYGAVTEIGEVSTLERSDLPYIHSCFKQHLGEGNLYVRENKDIILLVSDLLQSNSIVQVLAFFQQNVHLIGLFSAEKDYNKLELAKLVDKLSLPIVDKYWLACASIPVNHTELMEHWNYLVEQVALSQCNAISAVIKIPPFSEQSDKRKLTNDGLMWLENRLKVYNLYRWFANAYPNLVPEYSDLIIAETIKKINQLIECALETKAINKLKQVKA